MLKWIYWQTKEALSIHLIQVFFPHPFNLLQVPLQVHLPEEGFGFIEVFRCADAVEFLVFALQGPKEQGGQSGIFLNSEKRYCQMPSKEIWIIFAQRREPERLRCKTNCFNNHFLYMSPR
jgi:hypothetical protein